jgi:hypothetical protein
VDPGTSLTVPLPSGWEARPGAGSGELVWEARAQGGGPSAATLSLRRWDGTLETVQARYAETVRSFVLGGPWNGLDRIADAPPWSGSAPRPDGRLEMAWYFTLGGRGVALVAGLPPGGFEESWRQVDGALRAASRAVATDGAP